MALKTSDPPEGGRRRGRRGTAAAGGDMRPAVRPAAAPLRTAAGEISPCYATLWTRFWSSVATCVPVVWMLCTRFSTRAEASSAWVVTFLRVVVACLSRSRRNALMSRSRRVRRWRSVRSTRVRVLRTSRSKRLRAVRAATLELAQVGLDPALTGLQLALGLLAARVRVGQLADGVDDAVTSDEARAQRDEDGLLGVLGDVVDRRAGVLDAGLGGLLGGSRTLAQRRRCGSAQPSCRRSTASWRQSWSWCSGWWPCGLSPSESLDLGKSNVRRIYHRTHVCKPPQACGYTGLCVVP